MADLRHRPGTGYEGLTAVSRYLFVFLSSSTRVSSSSVAGFNLDHELPGMSCSCIRAPSRRERYGARSTILHEKLMLHG